MEYPQSIIIIYYPTLDAILCQLTLELSGLYNSGWSKYV